MAEVELADGTTGVGISIGGEPACFIIEVGILVASAFLSSRRRYLSSMANSQNHLARFVEGQDVRNLELMWCARIAGVRRKPPLRTLPGAVQGPDVACDDQLRSQGLAAPG